MVAATLPATVTAREMRRLQSQRSLPAFGEGRPTLSALARKLRLEPAQRVAVLNAPPGYVESLAPGPADLHTELPVDELFDAVQLFVNGLQELRELGPAAIRAAKPGGLLWIAYPKGGSGAEATDLPATPTWMKQDVLGEITSVTGYKPVALVKIDETWTALRFKRIE
jgi:hypothetical protein